MTINELLASGLVQVTEMLTATIGDFSDAEMMIRPTPAANHTTWQMGHLVTAAHMMISGSGATLSPLPAGFAEKYTKETSKIDDPSKFNSKAELLGLLTKINLAAAEWAKTLSAADLAKPAPEQIRGFAATVCHVLNLQPVHMAMHVGQFQVVRRKLGKPVLF